MNSLVKFHGSYLPTDVQFLLQQIQPEYKTIEEKERLIQTNQMHYSEVIHEEKAPSENYSKLFLEMTSIYKGQLAKECQLLAKIIMDQKENFGCGNSPENPICIMSLARAGTPIGVLLKRIYDDMGVYAVHYSISIIRDRGIDEVALNYVLSQFKDSSIAFVDGWTAKGVITKTLHAEIEKFNGKHNVNVPKDLYVVSDIGGTADFCATYSDYTMPSALMNSTVSGLVSRSVLNQFVVDSGGLHGCVYYDHLKEHDVSVWFIEQVMEQYQLLKNEPLPNAPSMKEIRSKMTQDYLKKVCDKYEITDINRIKPGIAEATRVMLRRVPDLLIVKNMNDPDVKHLITLAEEKQVSVEVDENMPFGACSLIKNISD